MSPRLHSDQCATTNLVLLLRVSLWGSDHSVRPKIFLGASTLLQHGLFDRAFHVQDACFRSSDNYLIAITYVYISRAGFTREEVNRY
jgi:hypothetical protein